MTPDNQIQFDKLVQMLWDGNVGEVEFTELGLQSGASLTAIGEALQELREEDQTWS